MAFPSPVWPDWRESWGSRHEAQVRHLPGPSRFSDSAHDEDPTRAKKKLKEDEKKAHRADGALFGKLEENEKKEIEPAKNKKGAMAAL